MNVACHNAYMAGDMNGATDLMHKQNRVIEILTGKAAECRRPVSTCLHVRYLCADW
jgi:hypothetical protein